MPRKQTFPPPVTRHKSGQARVRWQSKDYYLGVYGSVDAARNYAALLTRLASGQDAAKPVPEATAPATVTVSSIVARWFAEEAPRYADDGREVAQFRLSVAPLIQLFGGLPAGEFDCNALERVQLAAAAGTWQTAKDRRWHDQRGYPTGWSRRVVNRRIVRIRTIWRWAERKRLVPPGSFAHLCTLPGLSATDARVRHTTRKQPGEMSEVNRVVKHLPPVGVALLLTQWWTGMRSGEVRTMVACEVDTSGPVWLYRPRRHKMSHKGQDRTVVIGMRAQAVLRPWLEGKSGEDRLFPPHKRRKRSHYSRDGYAKLIREAAEAAGLPGWTAYRTRHGAKQRFTRSHGLDVARSILGQRSIDTTNDYGVAIDLRTAMDAARRTG